MIPVNAVYFCSCIPLSLVWLIFFCKRHDLRREIVYTSLLIGALSVATAYYWWTKDWWHPETLTHTRIGFEDFLMGFFSGGIMASAYEICFSKRLYRARSDGHLHWGGFTILLLVDCLMMSLFYGLGMKSFYASSIALFVTATVMYWDRRDLIINGIMSGLLMMSIAYAFYLTAYLVSTDWVAQTYYFSGIETTLVLGVPIEEYIFWFLAGLLFGPFYEYATNRRLRTAS